MRFSKIPAKDVIVLQQREPSDFKILQKDPVKFKI
jgi:hypothetical protein